MKTDEFNHNAEKLEIYLEFLRDEVGGKKTEAFIRGGEIESTNKQVNTIAKEARSLFKRLGNVDVLWDGSNYFVIKNQSKQTA